MESVEQGAPGDAGVKTVKRKRAMQSNSDCSQSSIKRGQPLWIRELSTAGSTACQQTMSTPEEQMTMANQQLNVQLQQFLETLETILRTARIELEEQVQSATSTTTHKDPMIRADRLFKLRSYLGAVDQRNELELTITEEASTTRLDAETHQRAQHADVLHTRDDEDTVQVSLCRCERGIRREEAVRERMGPKVYWTPEERVVLQTQRRRTDTDN